MFPIFKSKPFTAPSHKESVNSNSGKKFTNSLNKNGFDLCNRSFDTAQNLLEKDGKNLRQTKLNFCRQNVHENNDNPFQNQPSTSRKNISTTEFFLMPNPNEKSKSMKRSLQEATTHESKKKNPKFHNATSGDNVDDPPSNPMNEKGHDKLSVMGKVDFCFKTHKLYPNRNILYDVFGKVTKVLAGKNRFEHILLLRNINDRGPVIPSIYYDFDNILNNFPPGTSVRAVGEFMKENRLRIFKLEHFDCEKYESALVRIQNVTSFSLLRNTIESP